MSSGKKEILPGEHYPFRLVDGNFITYVFQTDTGVQYEIKFTHSPYIFSSQLPFSEAVYEFSLLSVNKPSGNPRIASDQLIPLTVVSIFIDFYKRFDKNNITVYICDFSDFKQYVRKRKFDQRFTEFNNGAFVKVDEKIKDNNGITYPVSIILKPSNPYRLQVFTEFIKPTDSYNDGK